MKSQLVKLARRHCLNLFRSSEVPDFQTMTLRARRKQTLRAALRHPGPRQPPTDNVAKIHESEIQSSDFHGPSFHSPSHAHVPKYGCSRVANTQGIPVTRLPRLELPNTNRRPRRQRSACNQQNPGLSDFVNRERLIRNFGTSEVADSVTSEISECRRPTASKFR